MAEFDLSQVDPGIRNLVRILRSWGYPTTDSGDGYSKIGTMECLEIPHVFMHWASADVGIIAVKASVLAEKLRDLGVEVVPGTVQMTYDPCDGSITLGVLGVLDAHIWGLAP